MNQDSSLAILNETVYAVKDYLDGEFKKYKTLKEAQEQKSYLINLLDRNLSEGKFQDLKKNGVGQTTILKFLNTQKRIIHI